MNQETFERLGRNLSATYLEDSVYYLPEDDGFGSSPTTGGP